MRYVLILLCALKVCLAQGYVVDTIAGNGVAGLSGDGGPAIRGMVNTPAALALDSLGRLYIADRGNSLIRRVDINGRLSTVATSPDSAIDDIAVDSRTTLYIVAGNRVRAIAATGDETEIQGPQGPFTAVRAIAADSAGNLLIGDGSTLVSVTSSGSSLLATLPDTITSIAVNPSGGAVVIAGTQLYSVGADGSFTAVAGASPTTDPARVAVDRWGDIYVSGVRITKLIGGKEYQLIGLGDPGYSGDGGPAVAASVMNPSGLVVDRGGNVYFSDSGNQRVRFLRPNQVGSINAVLPGDAAQEIWPKSIQLRWTVLSTQNTYDVLFGTAPGSLAKLGTSSTGAFALPNDLQDRTRYYWQVRTQVAPLPPLESPVFSFTTTTSAAAPPARPANPVPGSGLSAVSLSPLLSWTGGGAIGYQVAFGETQLTMSNIGTVTESRLQLSGLKPETNYVWQVIAFNETGVTQSPLWSFTTSPVNGYPWAMETLAGTALPTADGAAATDTVLSFPRSPVADSAGNIYFIDNLRSIRRIGTDGKLSTTVGLLSGSLSALASDTSTTQIWFAAPEFVYRVDTKTTNRTYITGQIGSRGYGGDNGPASQGLFGGITSIAVDRRGNLYIADPVNNRIRIVSSGGTLSTFAGNGKCGDTDGVGTPTNLPLCSPSQVAVDQASNVYIYASGLLLRVTSGSSDKIAANLGAVSGLAVDRVGLIYMADDSANVIRTLDPSTGDSAILAGSPSAAGGFGTGDRFWGIAGISFDLSGNVLVGDSRNYRIRTVDPASGVQRTIAGTSTLRNERGSGPSAYLYGPSDLAADSGGNVFIADSLNHRIRRVTVTRQIDTIAGGGETVVTGPDVIGHDGRDLRLELATTPGSIAIDQRANVLFNTGVAGARLGDVSSDPILGLLPNGIVTSYFLSRVGRVGGIARGRFDEIYVSDSQNHRIVRINADGTFNVIAGTGSAGSSGDGGQAVVAQLNSPGKMALSPTGDLYVAESGRIRRIEPSGRISTVAFENVTGLAFDTDGVLYASAGKSVYVTGVNNPATGTLTLFRIAGRESGAVPDKPVNALDANVVDARGLAITPDGALVLADYGSNAVRRLIKNVPVSLASVDGSDNQTINDKLTTPKPIQVRVIGRAGVPVSGVSVRYSISGTNYQENVTSVTDANGLANLYWTFPKQASDYRIEATTFAVSGSVVYRVIGPTQ